MSQNLHIYFPTHAKQSMPTYRSTTIEHSSRCEIAESNSNEIKLHFIYTLDTVFFSVVLFSALTIIILDCFLQRQTINSIVYIIYTSIIYYIVYIPL